MKTPGPPISDPLAAARANGKIRVGIGGWTFAPWRDNFYPAGLPQRRELEYASRRLTAIEINGTWYGAQKPAIYAKWREETPEGFVFSLKAPRYVAERKALASAGDAIDGFVFGGLDKLGDRLGPILWQFPPSRQFDANDFAAFLELLPRELDGRVLKHVLEVRHTSFLCAEYLELTRAHGCASVFTDSDEYPSFADLTGDFVYARLMRSRASIANGYSTKELDVWTQRAQVWSAGDEPHDLPRIQSLLKTARGKLKPREVFVFFIGSAKQRNPAAAKALLERLGVQRDNIQIKPR